MITRQGKVSYLRKRISPILHYCRKVRALLSTDAGAMGVDARKTRLVIITSATSTTSGFQQEVLSNICSLVIRLKHKQAMIWITVAQLTILLKMGRAGRGGEPSICVFLHLKNQRLPQEMRPIFKVDSLGCQRKALKKIFTLEDTDAKIFAPLVQGIRYNSSSQLCIPLRRWQLSAVGPAWTRVVAPAPSASKLISYRVQK